MYHQRVKNNILTQQQYNKLRYNRNRRNPCCNIGDLVFTKIFVGRGKLDPRFSAEPSIIVRVNHPAYIIRHESTGTERLVMVHDDAGDGV